MHLEHGKEILILTDLKVLSKFLISNKLLSEIKKVKKFVCANDKSDRNFSMPIFSIDFSHDLYLHLHYTMSLDMLILRTSLITCILC